MHHSTKRAAKTNGPLVPCPACARHVFANEGACPFCAHALPQNLATRAAPAASTRLTRAEAFTFNSGRSVPASDLGAIAGGAPNDAWDPRAFDLAPRGNRGDAFDWRSSDDGTVHPMYGAPVDPYDDPGGIHPMYGAPVDPGDVIGGPPDDGNVQPMYGSPVNPGDSIGSEVPDEASA